jgi:hypothetical protein
MTQLTQSQPHGVTSRRDPRRDAASSYVRRRRMNSQAIVSAYIHDIAERGRPRALTRERHPALTGEIEEPKRRLTRAVAQTISARFCTEDSSRIVATRPRRPAALTEASDVDGAIARVFVHTAG